jgi:hypothetical protein
MRDWLNAHKPAASAQAHLLLAALLWTVVGALLLFFGVRWALAGQVRHVPWLLALAVAVGLLKGQFVLKRTARRTVERIRARGDGRCIGGFLSLRSWAFVALMVSIGRLLRGSLLPRTVAGLVYVAVGCALLRAATWLWHGWYRQRVGAPAGR